MPGGSGPPVHTSPPWLLGCRNPANFDSSFHVCHDVCLLDCDLVSPQAAIGMKEMGHMWPGFGLLCGGSEEQGALLGKDQDSLKLGDLWGLFEVGLGSRQLSLCPSTSTTTWSWPVPCPTTSSCKGPGPPSAAPIWTSMITASHRMPCCRPGLPLRRAWLSWMRSCKVSAAPISTPVAEGTAAPSPVLRSVLRSLLAIRRTACAPGTLNRGTIVGGMRGGGAQDPKLETPRG